MDDRRFTSFRLVWSHVTHVVCSRQQLALRVLLFLHLLHTCTPRTGVLRRQVYYRTCSESKKKLRGEGWERETYKERDRERGEGDRGGRAARGRQREGGEEGSREGEGGGREG